MNRARAARRAAATSSNVPGGPSFEAFKEDLQSFCQATFGFESKCRDFLEELKKCSSFLCEDSNRTPIFWKYLAMITGPSQMSQFLELCKKHQVNLNMTNNRGETCLFHLVESVRVKPYNNVFDTEPLEDSTREWNLSGIKEIFRLLVQAGVKTDIVDHSGNDILKFSIELGVHQEFVKFLLEPDLCQPYINTKNNFGQTALQMAFFFRKDSNLSILLLENGADGSCIDDQNNTILHHLVTRPITSANLDYLRKHAKEMRDKKNLNGLLPITRICRKSFCPSDIPDEVFDLIIPSKEVINDKSTPQNPDHPSQTPLEALVGSRFTYDAKKNWIKKLIDAGAEVTEDVIVSAITAANILFAKEDRQLLDCLFNYNAKLTTSKRCVEECFMKYGFCGYLLTIVARHLPESESLKQICPDVILRILSRAHNSSQDFREIREDVQILLEEFNIDPNYYSEEFGTLAHQLACFSHSDKDVAEFLTQLIETGCNLDLNSNANIEPLWSNSLPKPFTALSLALYVNNYKLSIVLLKNLASTNGIQEHILKKEITLQSIGSDNDPYYFQVLEMLRTIGITIPDWNEKITNLSNRYPGTDFLRPNVISPPRLLELACLQIRQRATRESVNAFLAKYDLGPKVKEYMFLDHIRQREFPLPANFGQMSRSSDEEDEWLDQDEDYDDDSDQFGYNSYDEYDYDDYDGDILEFL